MHCSEGSNDFSEPWYQHKRPQRTYSGKYQEVQNVTPFYDDQASRARKPFDFDQVSASTHTHTIQWSGAGCCFRTLTLAEQDDAE